MNLLKSILLVFIFLSCSGKDAADQKYLIKNAKIWTGNVDMPEANAMLVSGSRIEFVGNLDSFDAMPQDIDEVDVNGAFIVPGFIDAHVHFIDGGQRLSSVQLRDAATPEDFIERIRAYADSLPADTWILGGDWDHENWGGELPHRGWIDEVVPAHPVFISRLDGHMALANSLAIEKAGIDNSVRDVEGGSIGRYADGRLNGIFKDNAMPMISKAIPEDNEDQKRKALLAAMDYVASKGVTSVHHVSGEVEFLQKMHNEGLLKTRIYVAEPLSTWATVAERVEVQGKGDEWLRTGALKAFVDGSLGSRTAAFYQPYLGYPNERGLFVTEPDEIYQMAKEADLAGLQLFVHAIGDRAIHELLNVYEKLSIENGIRDRRPRVEHAQHIAPKDIRRFADLQVIASVQPYHIIDDGRWAEKLIGSERAKTTYPFKSLISSGAILAAGSDWFVAPPTPLEGIYAAVTRSTLDGLNPQGWVPAQKITVEEAMQMYTLNAAYASFEEQIKGSLEVGKLADFVILEKDLRVIPPTEIKDVKIKATVVGGKTIFGDF